MMMVAQALVILMPAITKLVQAIFSPTYNADEEKAAILALQNAINEARLLQYMQDNPRS